MTAAAVVVAAGRGERMGAAGAKAFLSLAGTSLLVHSVRALAAATLIDRIVVVVRPDDVPRARAQLTAAGVGKVDAIVPGGEDRQASVSSGLAAVGEAPLVAVHDGVRPLVRPSLVDAVIAAAAETGAASAGMPIRQTVKLVAEGRVIETLDRRRLWVAHTPQAFHTDLLRRAHDRAQEEGLRASDDAVLVERDGQPVQMVEDIASNLKITVPGDLALAEAYLWTRSEPERGEFGVARGPAALRTGIGFDAHRLVPGRRLVLGGVAIDSPRGLAGHSDADVLTHAIMDALLGASGMGDLGTRFPSGHPDYRDADSIELLRDVAAAVQAEGWQIAHVDTTVVAEAPMLAPYVGQMRERLAAAMGLAAGAVNVKATTVEGLGAIGRHEGIAAQAVATLSRG
jgi:2-C-methyl-D-erythritol 4-phosphate cytidylyltransferase/2-C-methyl-D-erythritol 2,4-cyclodiphosphate synthase